MLEESSFSRQASKQNFDFWHKKTLLQIMIWNVRISKSDCCHTLKSKLGNIGYFVVVTEFELFTSRNGQKCDTL